jgi:hypothetical protein
MNELMNGNEGPAFVETTARQSSPPEAAKIDGATLTDTNPATASEVAPTALRVLPRRRWSAVQRLSPPVRLWINTAMRDGLTYKQILAGLAKKRVTCVSSKQLRDWHRTGYADWLGDQMYFEKLVLQLDSARVNKTPDAGKKNFRELSQIDIATRLHTAARKFNVERFCEHLNSKPESFFRLVFANALHERNAILRDRMELDATRYRDVSKKEKRAKKPKRGGVTLEEMERIERRINL